MHYKIIKRIIIGSDNYHIYLPFLLKASLKIIILLALGIHLVIDYLPSNNAILPNHQGHLFGVCVCLLGVSGRDPEQAYTKFPTHLESKTECYPESNTSISIYMHVNISAVKV